MTRTLVVIALLAPGVGQAQTEPGPLTPPAPAPAAAPAAPAPAAVPAAAPALASAASEETYDSWLVLKGGYFGTSEDFNGQTFSGSGEWELAVGTGRVLGIELAGGSMKTSAGGLEVTTVPILLTLRLAIPIAFVAPYAELGGGAYYNEAVIASRSVGVWTAGWQGGLGCDVLVKRLVVGAELRYMGIAPTFSTVGKVTLDRYAALLRAGVRF